MDPSADPLLSVSIGWGLLPEEAPNLSNCRQANSSKEFNCKLLANGLDTAENDDSTNPAPYYKIKEESTKLV